MKSSMWNNRSYRLGKTKLYYLLMFKNKNIGVFLFKNITFISGEIESRNYNFRIKNS